MRMLRWLAFTLLLAAMGLAAGCGQEQEEQKVKPVEERRVITVYSELDHKFTEELLQSFNEANDKKLLARAVYELKADEPEPDVALAEQRTLNGLKLAGKLKPAAFAAGDRLPEKLRDDDLYWYGVFYDPVVFLVNQQFARVIGQRSLTGWSDLENNERLRIAMENLSDSSSTQNFLGAFADALGETTSLNYLWNINRFVGQYAKFPFTPVRMTAVGDADLAITRQSYVFKYLENKFPAYVVQPKEGTPVNLYCMGIFKNCSEDVQALAFMEWLLADEKVQAVSQANNTGFLFLFPRGLSGGAVDASKLWLNKSYLQPAAQDALTKKWLERVRFSR